VKPLRVVLSDQSKKELKRIPRDLATRALKAIYRYAESGFGDVKRMQGASGQYRLRVGDWRVLFAIDYSTVELVVQHVLPRGSAYRD
jgi:mRNA interferase RelE/StbE